ncbi:MAG: hypothetical protein B6241_01720 [Spirochaetaceae bacterium 4572_59]|nr:MAG: hypothetical protein B6241_01720 [Spirochaetaceae bacterium 4572_59]
MEKRKYLSIWIHVFAGVLLFLNNSLSAKEEYAPVQQDALYLYSVESLQNNLPVKPSFSEPFRKNIRFYPPVDTEKFVFLQINTSEGISEDLTLLLNDREISLRLPAFGKEFPLYIKMPKGASLQGLIVSDHSSISRNSLSFSSSAPFSSSLLISWDAPETLEYHLPASDRNGRYYYLLNIRNRGSLCIEGVDRANLKLKAYSESQSISLYPVENSLGTWKLSPLSEIDFLSYEKKEIPPFPLPLTEGMSAVLSRSQEDWRHPDFELYKWVRFPDILIWDCRNYDVQNRFFRRLSYYVEKKGFRGTLLTNQELEGKHGWNAHDYRAGDLADFFNLARDIDFPLYEEERLMLKILLEENILFENSEGILHANNGAIISISRESIEILRHRFLVHEASHGLYFISPEYRAFILSLWEGLEDEERELWRFFLGWYGYDPTDEDLMINEFQAYLVQQKSDQAAEFFNVRLSKLIPQYPAYKELIERGTGENSASFNIWAGDIKHWMMAKWGLEPGDFFPLYKDL